MQFVALEHAVCSTQFEHAVCSTQFEHAVCSTQFVAPSLSIYSQVLGLQSPLMRLRSPLLWVPLVRPSLFAPSIPLALSGFSIHKLLRQVLVLSVPTGLGDPFLHLVEAPTDNNKQTNKQQHKQTNKQTNNHFSLRGFALTTDH